MRVIYKPTGQTGTIPDNKYDPKLFDKIVESKATTTPQKKSFGGLIKNIGTDIGSNIEGLKAIPGLVSSLAKGDIKLGEAGGAMATGVFNEYKDLATHPIETSYNKPLTTLLNLLPFIPVGKAGLAKYAGKAGDVAGDVGKAGKVAKTLDTAGDVAKTGRNYSAITQTGAGYTPIDDLIRASKDAASLEKVSAKAAKTVGPLERAGRTIRESVAGATGGKSALASSNIDEAMDFAKSRGYKGGSRSQAAQVSKDYWSVKEQIGKKLPTVKATPIDTDTVINNFITKVKDNINFNQHLPSAENLINDYVAKITRHAKNGFLSADDVFRLKNDLWEQVAKIQTAQPGEVVAAAIQQKGAAASTLYEVLNETLGTMAPEVKALTTLQAQMHNYSKGLTSMMKPLVSTNPLWNFTQATVPAAQKLTDNVGRFLWAAGSDWKLDKAVSALSKVTHSLLGPRTIVRQAFEGTPIAPLTYMAGRQAQTMQPQEGAQEAAQLLGTAEQPTGTTPPGFDPQANGQTALDLQIRLTPDEETKETKGKITPEMLMMAHLMMSTENASKIQKAYDAQEKASEGDMDANAKKRKRMLTSSIQTYEMLLKLSLMSESGWSGYVSAQAGKLPGVDGSYAEDLDRITNGLARQLGQTFAGEVGVATDQDVQRWLGLAPKAGDTYDERIRALQRMKQLIENESVAYGLTQ